MKIAYITAHSPYGRGETFVLEEMLMVAELGVDLIVLPRNPPKEIFHKEAKKILDRTIWLPLISTRIILGFAKTFFLYPSLFGVISTILFHSRSTKVLIKNLAVIPKAVFLAKMLKDLNVEHIHAHWGSTTSTMAWVISELTGIPWSFTLHRWDIAENNMLKLKVHRSLFARCISKNGREEVIQIVGNEYSDKIIIIHLGVRPTGRLRSEAPKPDKKFVIACPSNFVPKKGHRFLIEACNLLVEKGVSRFVCFLIGDGPLEREIREQISRYKLNKMIYLTGSLPHDELMKLYERGQVDAVVLPSIITDNGEKEGIPVALMEAIAFGIPVISTPTGGILELLNGGAGLLVPPGSAKALVNAILELMNNIKLREKLAVKGKERIESEFNLEKNVHKLINCIKQKEYASK